jgi:hypothetical protein
MTMKLHIAAVALLASLTLAACSDPQHYSRTGKGALIGGALGADAGALVGSAYGAPIKGAVVGAGAGALGGAAIGESLEKRDHRRAVFDYGEPYYFGGHRHHHENFDENEDEEEDEDEGQRGYWGQHGQWGHHHEHEEDD